ncbi:hypothetical protein K474DRAFT_1609674 [Panus rudis PR-1116 ss-1]|nr:hypothetical protein K474DRAFT_1609674 [Panus rudis PR-1116 ss-1]
MASTFTPNEPYELVEYTKDGTVSRMRSHKGNAPSLPQNKLCPLCPARFTRTTHLNRHLRTHSNERMHTCDKCHAQFTRSDLLSRHKRSCGDAISGTRSRRKSCQACADSKVRCDQQQPCSRCQSKGRECVYNAAPARPRAKAARNIASTSAQTLQVQQDHTQDATRLSPPGMTREDPSPSSSTLMETPSPPIIVPSQSEQAFDAQTESSSCLPPSSETLSDSSIANSSRATDYSTEVEGSRLSFAQEALEVQNHLNALFSNEMFDKFFNSALVPPSEGIGVAHNTSNAREEEMFGNGIQGSVFPWAPAEESQPFMASLDGVDYDTYRALQADRSVNTLSSSMLLPSLDFSLSQPSSPSPAELQYYLHLFFTRFLEQMPIMHVPTFNPAKKPAILINAMQACGALYAKTPQACSYIATTLASARDEVVAAFSKKPATTSDQVHLILTVSLIQTIGLFHQKAEQRAQSNMYHAMLVMLIRQSGLLNGEFTWDPSSLLDPTATEAAWNSWVCHETTKRALMLTFLHDCCHSIFFTLRPTYFPSEFNLRLPCEDSLWKATSYEDWHIALLKPSAYGSATDRLKGALPLQEALAHLAQVPRKSQPALILNPFSQFIIIHAILRKIFEDCLCSEKAAEARLSDDPTNVNPTIQYMLHNWLQSWFQSPETPRPSKNNAAPFSSDALPFYWIGQVLLLAYQEGLPPFVSDVPGVSVTNEAKFGLMKEWFRHIREFLKSGEQGPTLFWDELMKIRMQNWQTHGAGGDKDGLLGFFEN